LHLQFGTLQFGRYDTIVEVGYKSGLKMIAQWDEDGRLPSGYEEGFETERNKRRGRGLRRNSI
jgi:lysophospholipid hydrolase